MPNTEPDYTEHELQLLQCLEENNLPQEVSTEDLISIASIVRRRQSNRARILSSLRGTKLSKEVEDYLARLSAGSSTWDEETFIEGFQQAAIYLNLNATERAQYFGHELKGIHHVNAFTSLWNRLYPEQRIEWWEPDATRCCVETWSHIIDSGSWTLAYQTAGPFCQGMTEAYLGPTSLDCGMALEYVILMGCRWMFGNTISSKLFSGPLKFVQSIFKPGVDPLYPFYDDARFNYGEAETPSQRVLLKTVYNDPTYSTQHPGGPGRLYNCIVVDGLYFVLDPVAPKLPLTRAELEDLLRQEFNVPRNEADLAQIRVYARSSNGCEVAKELQTYQHLELSLDAWRARRRAPDVEYTLRVDRII